MVKKLKSFYVLVHFSIIGLMALLLSAGYFGQINNLLLDQFHGFIPMTDQIVVVTIDDESIGQVGSWPWKRDNYATIIENLNTAGAKTIAFDILFLEKTEHDEDFETALKNSTTQIILGSKMNEKQITKPVFSSPSVQSGYINVPTDIDSKVRRVQFSYQTPDQCEISWDGQILRTVFGENEVNVQNPTSKCSDEFEINSALNVPNVTQLTYSRQNPKTVSANSIIKGNFDKKNIENKIVLVGVSSSDVKSDVSDTLTNIFGEQTPGVFIHAHALNTVISAKIRRPIPYPLVIMILGVYLTFLFWLNNKIEEIRIEALIITFSIIVFFVIGIVAFEFNYNWPLIQTLLILLGHFLVSVIYRYFVVQNDKRFIENAFAHYLNPTILHQITHNPDSFKLGGETREMSIMFSDIRGFTNISEGMEASDLVAFLNEYLNKTSSIIIHNNGTIDKFIGDAVMAFWNAPLDDANHVNASIKTGLELLELLPEFNKFKGEIADISIGIGINTGNVVVGNIGGSDRFDYTVIGDAVNTASRLESLTKKYGVPFLISQTTFDGMNNLEGVITRFIDAVRVKGKQKVVKIYQPMRDNPVNQELIKEFESAMQLYLEGNFVEACDKFSLITHDTTSKIMEKRCRELIMNPPEDWDGSWTWETK